MKNQYHIDTTPEEDALFRDTKQSTQKKTFCKTPFKVFAVVLSVHVALAGIVSCQTLNQKTNTVDMKNSDPNNIIPSDREFLEKVEHLQPAKVVTQRETKPEIKTVSKVTSTENKLTKEYIIKKGDTIYSISKKYKLSVPKLLQLNKIKDPNVIVVGQKLKFL